MLSRRGYIVLLAVLLITSCIVVTRRMSPGRRLGRSRRVASAPPPGIGVGVGGGDDTMATIGVFDVDSAVNLSSSSLSSATAAAAAVAAAAAEAAAAKNDATQQAKTKTKMKTTTINKGCQSAAAIPFDEIDAQHHNMRDLDLSWHVCDAPQFAALDEKKRVVTVKHLNALTEVGYTFDGKT
jgi:hypothetical protein